MFFGLFNARKYILLAALLQASAQKKITEIFLPVCVVAKAARVGGEKLVQLKIVVGGDCGRLCNFFLQFANCLQFSVKAGKKLVAKK